MKVVATATSAVATLETLTLKTPHGEEPASSLEATQGHKVHFS